MLSACPVVHCQCAILLLFGICEAPFIGLGLVITYELLGNVSIMPVICMLKLINSGHVLSQAWFGIQVNKISE